MADNLYAELYAKIPVDPNEQTHSHNCGIVGPGASSARESFARTKIWRNQETVNDRNIPRNHIGAKLIIDVGISPVAPDHRVGAVWTVDNWETVRWAEAIWQETSPDAQGEAAEKWKVKMIDSLPPTPVKLCYALYVENPQGVRIWDNNNGRNYETIV